MFNEPCKGHKEQRILLQEQNARVDKETYKGSWNSRQPTSKHVEVEYSSIAHPFTACFL